MRVKDLREQPRRVRDGGEQVAWWLALLQFLLFLHYKWPAQTVTSLSFFHLLHVICAQIFSWATMGIHGISQYLKA